MQSKRSLLRSGGNQGGSTADRQSPTAKKTTSKTEEGVKEIKLPKLDPTKNSIAMQNNTTAKPQAQFVNTTK